MLTGSSLLREVMTNAGFTLGNIFDLQLSLFTTTLQQLPLKASGNMFPTEDSAQGRENSNQNHGKLLKPHYVL